MNRKIHSLLWIILVVFLLAGFLISPIIGLLAVLCMIAPVVVAFRKGRLWCGRFCPRGSFYDHIISRFSPKLKVPKILRQKWARMLIFVILISTFVFQLILAEGNLEQSGLVFLRLILITTIVGIVLGLFFHHRTWCMICPMGFMASWFSTNKQPITISSTCVNCKVCNSACPMQISVNDYRSLGVVADPDCIKCMKCTEGCPKRSLS